jgi:hypothetical protein
LGLTFCARWTPPPPPSEEKKGADHKAQDNKAEGEAEGKGEYKLYLDGQSDLFISNFRSPAICKLLEGLPTAVLLENKVSRLGFCGFRPLRVSWF